MDPKDDTQATVGLGQNQTGPVAPDTVRGGSSVGSVRPTPVSGPIPPTSAPKATMAEPVTTPASNMPVTKPTMTSGTVSTDTGLPQDDQAPTPMEKPAEVPVEPEVPQASEKPTVGTVIQPPQGGAEDETDSGGGMTSL